MQNETFDGSSSPSLLCLLSSSLPFLNTSILTAIFESVVKEFALRSLQHLHLVRGNTSPLINRLQSPVILKQKNKNSTNIALTEGVYSVMVSRTCVSVSCPADGATRLLLGLLLLLLTETSVMEEVFSH